MKDKLVALRDATKDNVDYIAGLLGIGYAVVDIGKRVFLGFFGFGIYFKVGSLLLLSVLIYVFIRNLKKIIANAKLSLDVAENLHLAEEQTTQLATNRLPAFQKIIPTTDLLRRIYNQAFSDAQKNLDPKCFLTYSYLDIVYNQNPTGRYTKKISISVGFRFFSSKKKMSISEWAKDLKLVNKKPTFEYQEEGSPTDPFFKNKYWRKALIEACERTVVHLITLRNFGIHLVGYSINDIYISFSREIPLSKTYSYSLANSKLYEGSFSQRKQFIIDLSQDI